MYFGVTEFIFIMLFCFYFSFNLIICIYQIVAIYNSLFNLLIFYLHLVYVFVGIYYYIYRSQAER